MVDDFYDKVTFSSDNQCFLDRYRDAFDRLITNYGEDAIPVIETGFETKGPVNIDLSGIYPFPGKYDNSSNSIFINPVLVDLTSYLATDDSIQPISDEELLLHELVHYAQPESLIAQGEDAIERPAMDTVNLAIRAKTDKPQRVRYSQEHLLEDEAYMQAIATVSQYKSIDESIQRTECADVEPHERESNIFLELPLIMQRAQEARPNTTAPAR